MRAIVEVRFGLLHGKKAAVEPGATLRIGRTHGDLKVDHDRQMSGRHADLRWDGTTCSITDVKSVKGTYVNGERVTEAVVSHGDWIKLGTTNLMVYFEEKTPPRRGTDVRMTDAKAKALAAIEAEPDKLFAVLDAARDPRVLELLRESVEECRSLYEGTKGDALEDVAPHLVALPKGSRLLRNLVVEGWGKRWGIFLTSKHSFKNVRTHLRHFLMVRDAKTDRPIHFRFWDPAAFRVVLPTCSVRQKSQFFADVSAVLCEETDGSVARFVGETLGHNGEWIVRPAQMRAVEHAMALEEFEEEMPPYLKTYWPRQSKLLGPAGLRQVIRLGIERAKPYGLTNSGLLRSYVELMFLVGSFFDTDPFVPWAGEILRDPRITDPDARALRLYEGMLWYRKTVAGPRREHDIHALEACDRVFTSGVFPDDPRFEIALVRGFFEVHSRRALYLGEERLKALVREAVGAARGLGVGTADGVSTVAFLMFTKGHGFATDPLLPWVRSALQNVPGDDEASRARRLELGYYAYRKHVLASTY